MVPDVALGKRESIHSQGKKKKLTNHAKSLHYPHQSQITAYRNAQQQQRYSDKASNCLNHIPNNNEYHVRRQPNTFSNSCLILVPQECPRAITLVWRSASWGIYSRCNERRLRKWQLEFLVVSSTRWTQVALQLRVETALRSLHACEVLRRWLLRDMEVSQILSVKSSPLESLPSIPREVVGAFLVYLEGGRIWKPLSLLGLAARNEENWAFVSESLKNFFLGRQFLAVAKCLEDSIFLIFGFGIPALIGENFRHFGTDALYCIRNKRLRP